MLWMDKFLYHIVLYRSNLGVKSTNIGCLPDGYKNSQINGWSGLFGGMFSFI